MDKLGKTSRPDYSTNSCSWRTDKTDSSKGTKRKGWSSGSQKKEDYSKIKVETLVSTGSQSCGSQRCSTKWTGKSH